MNVKKIIFKKEMKLEQQHAEGQKAEKMAMFFTRRRNDEKANHWSEDTSIRRRSNKYAKTNILY